MGALGHQDLRDVLIVTRKALESKSIDEMRRNVLECLEMILMSDKGTFFLADPISRRLDFKGIITRNADSRYLLPYMQYYHQFDPHMKIVPEIPSVSMIEEYIPFNVLVKSEYYNDHLKHLNIHYIMSLFLASGGRVLARLTATRTRSGRNFSESEKAKAQLIVQNLSPILEEKMLLEQAKRTSELFESIVIDIPHKGLIVLDESFQVIHVDENAKKTLTDQALTEEGQLDLEICLPEEIYRTCEDVKKHAVRENLRTCEQRLTLKIGPSKQPLPVLLCLVTPSDKSQKFLVCLGPGYSRTAFHQRQSKLGLTHREQEVASLICEGLTNEEIADKLYISIFTLLGHLRSIYRKLNVNSRSSLVHRLLSPKITSLPQG